jgi:hypothetical protein
MKNEKRMKAILEAMEFKEEKKPEDRLSQLHRANVDIEKDKLQKPANDLSKSVVALRLKVEELFRLSQELEDDEKHADLIDNTTLLVKEAKHQITAAIIDLDTAE